MITKKPKLVKCPKCKSAWYVKKESKKKIKLTRCPYCDELVVLIKAKKSDEENLKIIVPVYFCYRENGKNKVIDEDSIKEEFEAKLGKIIENNIMKVSVNWETDGEKVDLPEVVKIPNYVVDDEIADYLSDKYGWLVNSYSELD